MGLEGKQKNQEQLLRCSENRGESKRREEWFDHMALEMPAEYFSVDVSQARPTGEMGPVEDQGWRWKQERKIPRLGRERERCMSSVGTLPSFQTHPGNHTLCNLSPLVFQTALQLAHTTVWKSLAQVPPSFHLFTQQTCVLQG